MSQERERSRRRTVRLHTATEATCPSCHAHLSGRPSWCPQCRFTGADTMALFPETPPPLPSILDAAGLWTPSQTRSIESARQRLRKRFPQFDWRICTVRLDPSANLNLFAFWLMNTAPLSEEETAEHRAWTVLLLFDVTSGKATVTPGYSAEPWLSEAEWQKTLAAMWEPWASGDTVKAIDLFFKTSRSLLRRAWSRNNQRQSGSPP